MNPKQQYTEFWKFLSLTEDYFRYGKKTGEYEPPELTDSVQPLQAAPESRPAGIPKTVRPNTEHPLVHLNTDQICQGCGIARMGKKPVAAIGTENPKLLVLCGPPSVNAELNQVPLAAEEMDYFLKWMAAIELVPEKDVLLMNFPRCRPPGNRPLFPEELKRCSWSIEALVERSRPVVILTLGPVSSAFFTGNPGLKVSEIREQLAEWKGIPVLSTYSPDQVLSYNELKRPVWEDLKRVRNFLNGV